MAFDLETYKRITGRVDVGDVDLDEFRRNPLSADALRCIRYMHDVEQHTVCYLRDLLVTRAHRDPEITGFLTLWAFEEYWHGEVLAAVLEAHDEDAGADRVRTMRARLGWRDLTRPAISMLTSSMTRDFTAVHMTWGAVNEWTTQAGYARLISRADHPVLTQLLRRVMRQEGRHIDFYATEAAVRLDRSRSARRLTRLALDRLWRPVGSGVMPSSETRFVINCLFASAEGRAAVQRIDRRVAALPGLHGLRIVERAVDAAGADTDHPTAARAR